MRFIMLLLLMGISAAGYAQKITLLMHDEPIEAVFKELRRQSKYDFLYNEALVKDLKPVHIDVKSASVKAVLDSLFLNSQLRYSIQDKLVMITRKDMTPTAQETFTISGIVKDREGRLMPGAGILLGSYKRGTVADDNGRFRINGLKSGNYTVLVEMIGYETVSKGVLVSNGSSHVEIILTDNVKLLKEVEIRPDPNRQRYIKLFKKTFIGTTSNAELCEILNPEVLYTDYDHKNQILRVSADDLIIVENKALGYRIKYLLKYYERDGQTGVVVFYGYPYFEELKASGRKRRNYLKKRQEAYIGSPQHFFRALYHNRSKEEGFVINNLIKIPNYLKHGQETLTPENTFKLTSDIRIKGRSWSKKDSMNYLALMKKESDTLEVLVRKDLSADDLLQPTLSPMKLMSLKQALYITFTGEKEGKLYSASGYKIKRPRDLTPFQVSLVYPLRGPVGFYEDGALYDPGAVLFEGIWAWEKVADMVPLDYSFQK
jgi:hypothetical protein